MSDQSYTAGYPPYAAAYAPYGAAPAAAADYQWGNASWGSSPGRGTVHAAEDYSSRPSGAEAEPDALQSRTLFFGRLCETVTEDMLKSLCEQHGDVKKVSVYPDKHMGFVEFFDVRHSEAAREALKGSELAGKKIEVQFSAVKRPDKDGNMGTLYIRPTSGASASTTLNDPNSLDAYRRLFSSYGDIKKVSVNRKRDAEKFIEFHDIRDAAKALEALNGHNFNGVTLQICFAQNASRTYNRDAGMRRPPRTPDNYGPYRNTSYGSGARSYVQSPYSPPVLNAAAAAYGPYGVCPMQTTYPAAYGYQQPNGYPHGWPPTHQGPAGAPSPYGVPPRCSAPAPMYGAAPGGAVAPHWRQPQ